MADTALAPKSQPSVTPTPSPEPTPAEVKQMNQELRQLVLERIENRMHSRGLRANKDRDALVSQIYTRYLECKGNPDENLFDAKAVRTMLEATKKLAALADLIDGKNGSTELGSLMTTTDMAKLLQSREHSDDTEFWLTPESLLLEQKLNSTYKNFWNDTFTKQVAAPTNHYEPEKIAELAGIPSKDVKIFDSSSFASNDRLLFSTGKENRWAKRPMSQVHTIVVHESAGPTLDGAISTLKQRGLSYHFIIDKDGTVYQLQPIDRKAPHARKDGNDHAIGICLIGGGKNDQFGKATDAQQKSLAGLCGGLKAKQPTLHNVMLHKEVDCCCTDCHAAGADMNLLSQRTGLSYNPDAL